MAPRLMMVYKQMSEPRYVMAMGACAITGRLYLDSYNVLSGTDSVVPVDVNVSGCLPRPETLIQGTMLLQEKIKRSKIKHWQSSYKTDQQELVEVSHLKPFMICQFDLLPF